MQVQGLRWPDEVGIGRHGCRAFELDRLWLRTEAWSGHGGYGQFCLGRAWSGVYVWSASWTSFGVVQTPRTDW